MSMDPEKSADDGQRGEQRPSKSQRKREALALQDLGERLATLPAGELARVPMPAELAEAVAEVRTMGHDSGRRRQLRYIGKLLRTLDAEPLQAALAAVDGERSQAAAHHRMLESLCQALLGDDGVQLGALLDEHPGADRQHLRQLIRNGRREQQAGQAPRSRRELFRYLRTLLAPEQDPPA